MAINKKLIHFEKKQTFNNELAKGNILGTSIVFIQDAQQIWTHGLFYDASTIDLSNIEESIQNLTNNKVDKVSGKGLSTNDYTTTEKNKLGSIAEGAEVNVQSDWNVSNTNSDAYIKNKPSLAEVATSGSYKSLTNKPTIDTALSTTSTNAVQNKAIAAGINAKYTKPSTGIPKTDLASAVLTSLGKADTALQSETDPVFSASAAAAITDEDIENWNSKTSNTGTVTGVKMNGSTKNPSNGVVDLGTVITAHQDISGKLDKTTASNTYATKAELSSKYAFAKVSDGTTTITADTTDDTLTVTAGSGASIALDSTNDKLTISHSDTSTLSGAYGPTANVTGSNNATIVVPQITVDGFGHVTGVTNRTYTSKDTDTKVTSVGNHYTPDEDTAAAINASGGSATNITGTSGKLNVVTGLKRDAKGHIVGVTSANIYSTDNNTLYSAITADELSTGTATTSRTVTAKVLNTYISDKVSSLVDSAPDTLNTLNELAAALGDDPNFATTMSTVLGKKSEKAFANITVGNTTIEADSKEDTLTLVAGSNVTITPDATNDKITIAAKDTTYSFSNSNPTLSWGKQSTVGTVGGTALTVTMPANPDSHYSTAIRAGESGTNSNAAVSNPYVKVLDNTTYRSLIRLVGGGATTVSSDASGNITISSTNTTYSAGSGLVLSGTTFSADGSAIINALGEGTSAALADDYIVAQYAGGGTTTTTYHRRKLSNIFKALTKSDITTALGYTPPTTNTTYTFSNANPTLAWGKLSTIGTVGGVNLTVTMPANPNSDTHWTTGINTGASGAVANSAQTNPYVTVKDNSTYRSQIRLVGGGATTVKSDANGNITISSTDTNTWRSISDSVSSTSSDVSASSKAVKTAYDLAASKTSNTGTVTSVIAGTGLSGGTITTSGTLSVAYGTTAGTACQGNDSRLSNARPASDVYSWAKQVNKPIYTKSEVGLGNVDNTADANKSVNYANSAGYVGRDRGVNTVTTLASLPVTKSIVTATLSSATNISLAAAMNIGESITVICTPSANFTQPIPTSGSFISMDGDVLSVTSGKPFEINILCYATGKYSISCKISK